MLVSACTRGFTSDKALPLVVSHYTLGGPKDLPGSKAVFGKNKSIWKIPDKRQINFWLSKNCVLIIGRAKSDKINNKNETSGQVLGVIVGE